MAAEADTGPAGSALSFKVGQLEAAVRAYLLG